VARVQSIKSTDLFSEISVQIVSERGAPQPGFVIHTQYLEKASEILQLYHLSPLPLSIPMMQSLPLPPGYKIPTGGDLVIDWSLDDPNPDAIIGNVVIPQNLQDQLAQANFDTKSIMIILEEKKGAFGKIRTEAVPGVYESYFLDWIGALGISVYIRRGWQNVSSNKVAGLLNAIRMRLEDNGPATGLFTEMGYLYRLNEDWELAAQCYRREIKFGLKPDGWPGVGTIKALGNLGIVFKRFQDYSQAQDCLIVALTLNPNFFEGLISIAGILENPEAAIKCLSRAYLIRPNDPRLPQAFESAAMALGQPTEKIQKAIKHFSSQIDLSQSVAELKPTKPISTIVRRLLSE
jgi:tetratricopeptide (TPR) repeat protein